MTRDIIPGVDDEAITDILAIAIVGETMASRELSASSLAAACVRALRAEIERGDVWPQHQIAELEASRDRLRFILRRYGDRVPMATCHRADWQQEIDDAMAWVANQPPRDTANPEPAHD